MQNTALVFGTQDQAGDGLVQADKAVALAEESTTLLRNNFFGNGFTGVLWQATDGSIAEWQLNGKTATAGTVIAGSGGPIASPGTDWRVVGTGDFGSSSSGTGAARGVSDILLQSNSTGQVADWIMSGSTPTGGGNIGTPTMSKLICAGDFNDDGKSDLLFQASDGTVSIWLMNGATASSTNNLGDPGAAWKAVGVGDFRADGTTDVVFQNSGNGQIMVWLTNGASLQESVVLPWIPGAGWTLRGIGDFNGDSKSDLLFQNTDGTVAVWDMQDERDVLAGMVLGNPGATWQVAGAGDFNGDGASDVLLRNPTNGQIGVWLMNASTVYDAGTLPVPGANWTPIVS
jgi:FG-GAP-like repeat